MALKKLIKAILKKKKEKKKKKKMRWKTKFVKNGTWHFQRAVLLRFCVWHGGTIYVDRVKWKSTLTEQMRIFIDVL